MESHIFNIIQKQLPILWAWAYLKWDDEMAYMGKLPIYSTINSSGKIILGMLGTYGFTIQDHQQECIWT